VHATGKSEWPFYVTPSNHGTRTYMHSWVIVCAPQPGQKMRRCLHFPAASTRFFHTPVPSFPCITNVSGVGSS
jgi:hypothetical protein